MRSQTKIEDDREAMEALELLTEHGWSPDEIIEALHQSPPQTNDNETQRRLGDLERRVRMLEARAKKVGGLG